MVAQATPVLFPSSSLVNRDRKASLCQQAIDNIQAAGLSLPSSPFVVYEGNTLYQTLPMEDNWAPLRAAVLFPEARVGVTSLYFSREFLKGHFGRGYDICVPGCLQLESLVQSLGFLIIQSKQYQEAIQSKPGHYLPLFREAEEVKFLRSAPLPPGAKGCRLSCRISWDIDSNNPRLLRFKGHGEIVSENKDLTTSGVVIGVNRCTVTGKLLTIANPLN